MPKPEVPGPLILDVLKGAVDLGAEPRGPHESLAVWIEAHRPKEAEKEAGE